MSDSEILTLIVLMDYLPFPGETQFLGFIRANYREWFPELLDQSQFNRRLRQLGQMLEMLRRTWVKQLGATDALSLVIDALLGAAVSLFVRVTLCCCIQKTYDGLPWIDIDRSAGVPKRRPRSRHPTEIIVRQVRFAEEDRMCQAVTDVVGR